MENVKNKYNRQIKGVLIDVYDILQAFPTGNPALDHAVKKALCPGNRGHKSREQDFREIHASWKRAMQLEGFDLGDLDDKVTIEIELNGEALQQAMSTVRRHVESSLEICPRKVHSRIIEEIRALSAAQATLRDELNVHTYILSGTLPVPRERLTRALRMSSLSYLGSVRDPHDEIASGRLPQALVTLYDPSPAKKELAIEHGIPIISGDETRALVGKLCRLLSMREKQDELEKASDRIEAVLDSLPNMVALINAPVDDGAPRADQPPVETTQELP